MSKPKEQARVILTQADGIATLSLNRPRKMNAFDMPMFYALDKVMRQLRKDKSLRVLIVTAHGEHFSSGIDVKTVMQDKLNVLKLLWKWRPGSANLAQRMSYGLRQIPVPVISVIQGRCFGAGLQFILGSDFRFAAMDASFSIMEGRWGLIPDMGGTLALRENMALDKALLLAMSAKEINAEEALASKLISELHQDPLKAALELANTLKKQSPDTLAACKKLYQQTFSLKTRRVLFLESLYQWRILLGKNQMLAVKQNKQKVDVDFKPRQHW